MTSHPEPVSQSLTPQQQPQYNLPERDKQLLFSEYNFEDLSASFRSLYKSVFEQSLSQQGEVFLFFFFNTFCKVNFYCNMLLRIVFTSQLLYFLDLRTLSSWLELNAFCAFTLLCVCLYHNTRKADKFHLVCLPHVIICGVLEHCVEEFWYCLCAMWASELLISGVCHGKCFSDKCCTARTDVPFSSYW